MNEVTKTAQAPTRTKLVLPILPLRDVVIFPHMVIPLFVGRAESIRALEDAMTHEKQIFLTAQKDPSVDVPKEQIFIKSVRFQQYCSYCVCPMVP